MVELNSKKTIIAKIPAKQHAFLVNNHITITKLVISLIDEYINNELYKIQLLKEKRKKEEELYATYTKPQPIEQSDPSAQPIR